MNAVDDDDLTLFKYKIANRADLTLFIHTRSMGIYSSPLISLLYIYNAFSSRRCLEVGTTKTKLAALIYSLLIGYWQIASMHFSIVLGWRREGLLCKRH